MTPSSPQQDPPGRESLLHPEADHGEHSYKGSARLADKVAVITGADSGIGKAVAIAFAREGADLVLSYLDEHDDAADTKRWVEEAGRRAVIVPGDLSQPSHCRAVVAKAVEEFGRLDVLVSNAAFQMTYSAFEDIPDDEWDHTLATNVSALFHLTKAAIPHMRPGSSIIATSSINSDTPSPTLLPYDKSDTVAVRRHQGRDRKLCRRRGAASRGEGDQGEQCCTRPHLDPLDPLYHAP